MLTPLLFSGHMIDRPNRSKVRFPPHLIDFVTAEIVKNLREKEPDNSYFGLAGAGCGGDIIFHESCLSLGIQSQIYLPKNPVDFKSESVSYAGEQWSQRFDTLLERISFKVLNIDENTSTEKNLWEHTNSWMIDDAMKMGRTEFVLLALWNDEQGDGKGGTADMVSLCNSLKQKVRIISI